MNNTEKKPKRNRWRRCPDCGGIVKVYTTRQIAGRIRRYTRCLKCGTTGSTEEFTLIFKEFPDAQKRPS